MFYKNVLLVIPIWVYGFYSFFAGTSIYDVFMYNMYNSLFTFIPIIWFSVFDQEFDKSQLLKDPKLYKIGLEDVFFNKWVFWRWFFYGVWQGSLLILLTFWSLGDSVNLNGVTIGCLDTNGEFVYGAIVIVANLKVLVSSHQFTIYSILSVIISIGSYFAILVTLGYVSFYSL